MSQHNGKYYNLLTKNPASILATNLRTKSGLSDGETYNWIDLRKKLINSDGKYSVETNSDTKREQQKYFPQATYSPVGNRFYIKAKDFEAFCTEQASKFFEDVKGLSVPGYLLGWNLSSNTNMSSVSENPRYNTFKEGSRLVGYPLTGNNYIQHAYFLQMGDTGMTLRTEFNNHVLGLYNPEGVTAETLTLAGNFLYVLTNNTNSNLYSQMFDSEQDSMFSFDFRYDNGTQATIAQLQLMHKEHETLIKLQTMRNQLDIDHSTGDDTMYREFYRRVFEIQHDRASKVADTMLVGIYKSHQSGFKNTCTIINAGNYDLDQAIEIAIEAAQILRG